MSYWKGKRVLVTGGAGFIGCHLVEALREQSCTDIFVVRSREYDLVVEEQVSRLFSATRPQVVFHLAGLVGSIVSNKEQPADFFYQNLMMGTLVMHYASVFGVEKLVATMSGAGYPANATIPFRETSLWDGLPQPETAPYSLAKRLLHVQGEAYFRQHDLVSIVTIPGNAYGPFDNFDLRDGRVIAALIRKFVEADDRGEGAVVIWGTGRATRDFVYVRDLADGILRAAERYDQAELVNISSGIETSIRDVVDILQAAVGYTGKVIWDATRPEGQSRRVFDITKARQELCFEPTVCIEDGLRRTVAWFKAHRVAPHLS
jgi:GDP-L-fucose synthase